MARMSKAMRELIPFPFVLLDTYRELGLSENEAMVILMIDHLLAQDSPVLGSDAVALKMSMKGKDIDQILADLVSKNLVSYGKIGDSSTLVVTPIKEKAYEAFQKAMDRLDGTSTSERRVLDLGGFFEEKLERMLSPLERSTLSRFVTMGFTDKEIKDALLDCLNEGKPSLKAVERQLMKRRKSDDLQSEGASAVSYRSATPIGDVLAREKKKWDE